MAGFDFESFLQSPEYGDARIAVGRASEGNIEKDAHVYHVITKSNDGGSIFYKEVGDYRHTLMCKLCDEKRITILFSVTMPNHTHDVFLTPDWELLPAVIRNLNMNITKFLRKRFPSRYKPGLRILRRYPVYVPVRSVADLFYIGKYIYDNPAYLRAEGKYVPHTCFWMFDKNYFPGGYDGSIYMKLFNLTPQELLEKYENLTAQQIREYAFKAFPDSPLSF